MYDRAVADLTASFAIDHSNIALEHRTIAYNLRGDFDKAEEDYWTVLNRGGTLEGAAWVVDGDARLRLFIIRRRQHLETESTGLRAWVKAYVGKRRISNCRYLMGELSENECLAAAQLDYEGVTACYCVGMGKLLIGETKTARGYFAQSVAIAGSMGERAKQICRIDFLMAKAELARLGQPQ